MAVCTIDMAVWDAVAKIEGKPLNQLPAERHGSGKHGLVEYLRTLDMLREHGW